MSPRFLAVLAGLALLAAACPPAAPTPPRSPFVALAEVEKTFGHLVTAGNHPTPNQNGTGDRLGIFVDDAGTAWGLPLADSAAGVVVACAPAALAQAKPTDSYPAGATIIGATNEPTGWRGGTGNLELLLRDASGGVRWLAVHGAPVPAGPVCWAQEDPGPPQQLTYYRLTPAKSAQ